jgi:polyphosphate kinase 2 (PPK2 family)
VCAKLFSGGDTSDDQTAVETLASELDALQNLFYADRRVKLLVALRGTDTSEKDGTLCSVFSRMSPLSVQTVPYYDS